MMSRRKHLYPRDWKQLVQRCKAQAQWRCERCRIRHGSRRTSKRTGRRYQVWLHAAHRTLHDTLNPQPALLCLCPTCHGRYDHCMRLREGRVTLECLKHRYQLHRCGKPVICEGHRPW